MTAINGTLIFTSLFLVNLPKITDILPPEITNSPKFSKTNG